MKILAINCKPDLSYFTNRELPFDVTYETINLTMPLRYLYKVKDAGGSMVDMSTPDPTNYMMERFGSLFQYSIVLIGWSPDSYGEAVRHTGGYTSPIALPSGTRWCTIRQDTPPVNNYAVHEIHHALCAILNENLGNNHSTATTIRDYMDMDSQSRPYYLNDYPEDPTSNYAQTFNQIKLYLPKLLAITYPTQMKTYLNFNPKSDPYMVGVDSRVMDIAQKVRTATGISMRLTSGLRTTAQNNAAGGVSNSAHLKGLALDFAITNQTRQAFLKALLTCGTPIFIEDCPDHIHFDIDSSIHPLGDMIVSQNG